VRLSAQDGTLSTTADLGAREPATEPEAEWGTGRELFALMRAGADEAERGASTMLALAGL
jgi:phosphogluconate dehydratase